MDSEAASPLIGFMVAVLLFSVTFSYVVFRTAGEDASDSGRQSELNGLSRNLAGLIVDGAGLGWYNLTAACADGVLNETELTPDNVGIEGLGRFGLGQEQCVTGSSLDYNKVINLRDALVAADADNDAVDYEEARASLGLTNLSLDFHIRSQPVLATIRQILNQGYKDPNLRPLYIGDYDKVSQGGAAVEKRVQHSAGVVNNTDNATVWVNVTNNGTLPAPFQVTLAIPLSTSVQIDLHTPVILGSASYNATFDLPKSSDWTWANATSPRVTYTISDIDEAVGSGNISFSGVSMSSATERNILFATPAKLFFEMTGGGSVNGRIYYESHEGNGAFEDYNDWTMRLLYTSNGTSFENQTISNDDEGWETFRFETAGNYSVRLESDSGARLWSFDIATVVAAGQEPNPFSPAGDTSSYVPDVSVEPEAAFLDTIVQNFEPNVFDVAYDNTTVTYASGGDIYPDIKQVMDNELPLKLLDANGNPTLANYNVIFAGSNIDHQVMTSAAAKNTIRDWVNEGGILIVFGSSDQAVQWLQPLFHSAIDSAGSGITVPDENHPLLNVPNELDYESYEPQNITWGFNTQNDADHFTHIVLSGTRDYLAASEPGEFGKGRVILAGYRPYDLIEGSESGCSPGATELCPGLQLIHNFVSIAYQGLYIDYGPPLPENRPNGSWTRITDVDHPELATRVGMVVTTYVF